MNTLRLIKVLVWIVCFLNIQKGIAQDTIIDSTTVVVKKASWLDDLEAVLGAGTKNKVNGWINNGLDETKTQTAFSGTTDKAALLQKLETAKSIYHQRVYIQDWNHIPGITNSGYVNNSMPEARILASNFGVSDTSYNLPSYRASTFSQSAELIVLPPGTKLYRVTDRGGEGGAFWTLIPPDNLADVIGGTAVMPEWNGFSKVVEYTVPAGGIKVWKGKAAAQPISQIPQLQSTTCMLSGGKYQIFINDCLRDQTFKNAIFDVTLIYKKW